MEHQNKCGVECITLENGFRIFIKRLVSDDIVGTLIVDCGSIYETRGRNNGISHFIEHLVYAGGPNGSRRSSPMYKIERLGDEITPNTGQACTKYQFTFSKQRWVKNLRLLIGAVLNLQFSRTVFLQEQKVLENEKVNDTEPLKVIAEKRIFPGHPLGMPMDGTLKTIVSFTPRKVRNWHKRFYRPSRMTLVICGNISSGQVINAIKKTGLLDPNRDHEFKIKEPAPTDIRFGGPFSIKGINENKTLIVFNGPTEPRDKLLYDLYFDRIINDTSIVSMRWAVKRRLGLHVGMGFDRDTDITVCTFCSYFYIELFAPSKKVLDRLEKRFFAWIDEVCESGLNNDIFTRAHSTVTEEMQNGIDTTTWWDATLSTAITEGSLSEIDFYADFCTLNWRALKEEINGLFKKTLGGENAIFRTRKT